ncbi:MAG TPA: YraN family protein [Ideonella sp.]|nr:YraN family protein [Ideonella sp.]
MFTKRDPGQTASEPSKAASGAHAEDQALAHLQRQGLRLLERNYRVARGPSRRAGEIDLILRDRDGTLVFVEVRARRDARHGGAAASISASKRARIVYAAQHYLVRLASPPPCRFDVVAVEGGEVQWLRAAFDAG